MFGSKQQKTVIAKGLKIVGSVTAEGLVEVNGQIDGRGEAVEQHLTQIDNRLAETTKRLDLGLDQQADMPSKINKIDADLTFIHKRIDMLDQPKPRGSNPPH